MNALHRHPTGRLAAFAEKALDSGQMAQISQHLAECATCREDVAEWNGLFSALAQLPRFGVPFGLRDRIVLAVAREALAQRQRARSIRRRVMAAVSWAYGSGVITAAALIGGVILVPSIRNGAVSGLTWVYGVGIHAGLFVVQASSMVLVAVQEMGGSLAARFAWVETVFRALSTALSSTELGVALAVAVLFTIFLTPMLLLRALPRRSDNREVSHVGSLLV